MVYRLLLLQFILSWAIFYHKSPGLITEVIIFGFLTDVHSRRMASPMHRPTTAEDQVKFYRELSGTDLPISHRVPDPDTDEPDVPRADSSHKKPSAVTFANETFESDQQDVSFREAASEETASDDEGNALWVQLIDCFMETC